MSIMIEEETKNSYLVEALQLPLPPVPSKTPSLPPLPVPTLVPTIATSVVRALAASFPALSTKFQLNSILNHKWKSPIYSSDATSLDWIDNGSYLPYEHISALVAALSDSSDEPLDDPKSEIYSRANIIVLGNHIFVSEWSGKSCTVNTFNDCLGSVKDVPIIDAYIAYDFPYSHECYILLYRNVLYLTKNGV